MPGRSDNTRNVRAGKVRPQRHDVVVACTCTCRMRRGREGPGTTMAYRARRVRRCHMLGWQPGKGLQWRVLLLSCSGINLRHCTQPQKVGDGGGNALHHHILHIIHLCSSLLRFIDIHQHLASRCQHRSLFTYFHTLWTVCLSSVIVEECAAVQRKAKCCCRCGSLGERTLSKCSHLTSQPLTYYLSPLLSLEITRASYYYLGWKRLSHTSSEQTSFKKSETLYI